jgi:hypothetical protein
MPTGPNKLTIFFPIQTNIFIVNLALSDLLMMSTQGLPVAINAFMSQHFMYSSAMCRIYGCIGGIFGNTGPEARERGTCGVRVVRGPRGKGARGPGGEDLVLEAWIQGRRGLWAGACGLWAGAWGPGGLWCIRPGLLG